MNVYTRASKLMIQSFNEILREYLHLYYVRVIRETVTVLSIDRGLPHAAGMG